MLNGDVWIELGERYKGSREGCIILMSNSVKICETEYGWKGTCVQNKTGMCYPLWLSLYLCTSEHENSKKGE